MLPDAPARLSTITDWPSDLVSCSASERARMSVEPPGAQGTTRVIGRSGHWAEASAAKPQSVTSVMPRRMMEIMKSLLVENLWRQRSAPDRVALHAARIGGGAQHEAAFGIALAAAGRHA